MPWFCNRARSPRRECRKMTSVGVVVSKIWLGVWDRDEIEAGEGME